MVHLEHIFSLKLPIDIPWLPEKPESYPRGRVSSFQYASASGPTARGLVITIQVQPVFH